MVQKRQLAAEDYDVSNKHLKLENSCQLVSCLEFPSTDLPNSVIAEGCFSIQILEKDIALIQPDDTYAHLLNIPPLKQVPVGPEYQADIPEWCGYDYDPKNTESSNENKFFGSCVIQMPNLDLSICEDPGRGRRHCCCEDPGSVRCVQSHIREARENLRGTIGDERFSELGFCNMGDVVACKWTEEDERLFHEVVYSNPVSLGINFWDNLADAFPSRTNREIISYYFNVFVLQRRAEQNRSDPVNADSDDDEWQGDYSSEDDDDLCKNEIREYGYGTGNPVFDYYEDDSCTSSDTVEPQSSEVNHDFIFEPSDSKLWDLGYFSIPRNKVDFLPTGSMIEEVFGVESWSIDNNKRSS